MAILLLMVAATAVSLITASCPENEEPSFCGSHAFVPQAYCPSVEQQDKWECKKRSYGRCVCSGSLYRRADGKCVQKNECGGPEKKVVPGSGNLHNKTIEFLKTYSPIHLQMMSHSRWIDSSCECVKSQFEAAYIDSCERTVECYRPVKVLYAPPGPKATIGKYKLVNVKERADFHVSTSDGETTVRLKTILEVAPSSDPPKVFSDIYVVKEADTNCLLVTYSVPGTGKEECLLWGLSRQQINKETTCYKKLLHLCTRTDTMYDMTEREDPCDEVDKYDERLRKRLENEAAKAAQLS